MTSKGAEPLPWDTIEKEVVRATKQMKAKRFVNIRHITAHIDNNRGKFRECCRPSQWHPENGVTPRTISHRVNQAIKNMKWKKWNENRCPRSGRVYIVPWVKADPSFAPARGEGRALT